MNGVVELFGTDINPTKILHTMLQESVHSDITFVCSDGRTVHAHKSVLASASSYFWIAFHDLPLESAIGRWETKHSFSVMMAVLTFIYTRKVKWDGPSPMKVWAAAHEFGIQALARECEECCQSNINLNNIMKMIRLARHYVANDLEQQCFSFVRENFSCMFTNPDFLRIATDDPKYWLKLVEAIDHQAIDKPVKSCKVCNLLSKIRCTKCKNRYLRHAQGSAGT